MDYASEWPALFSSFSTPSASAVQPDAARFGDEGADTLGHIACRLPGRQGRPRGPAVGPVASARDGFPRPRRGLSDGDRTLPAGTGGRIASRRRPSMARRQEVSIGKDTPSGHWEIAGLPVPFDWGYFPQTVPTFPADLVAAIVARSRAPRHPRRLPCIGHRDHRAVRRGAHPHRQADPLHLGRFRAADRRA